jgi:hypothetical protein
MLFIGLFILELFILYLLSRNLYVLLFRCIHHVTRNKRATIHLVAFLFLPGTFLHEVAHWITANLLFVPTGSMTLIPKMDEKGNLRLGSVMIAKTDIIRRFLIGAAPVILGVSIILATLYFAFQKNIFDNYLIIFLLGCLVFQIGNTMFSSKKDMEGALGLILTVLVAGIVFYFLGLQLHVDISRVMELFSNPMVTNIFLKGSLYLLIPILIDLLFILILKPIYKSGNK